MPLPFVGSMMMLGTQWHQVVEVCVPAITPKRDVMRLAVVESHITLSDCARVILRTQRSSLFGVGQPVLAASAENDSLGVDHDRDHVGITRQPLDRGDGILGTIV